MSFDQLNELAVYSQGRRPAFTEQSLTAPNNPPVAATEGVVLSDAVVAILRLVLRNNPAAWTLRSTLVDYNAGDLYKVTADDCDFVYQSVGVDSVEDTLAALSLLIGADDRFTAAVRYDTDGTTALGLTISSALERGAPFEYSFDTDGAATMTWLPEPTFLRFRVWGLPYGESTWQELDVAPAESIHRTVENNWSERLVVAGFSRLYVEVTETDGDQFAVYIGPCLEE
jgi:hypothetical protein